MSPPNRKELPRNGQRSEFRGQRHNADAHKTVATGQLTTVEGASPISMKLAPSVKARALAVRAEVIGEDLFSSCPVAGVLVRVQDAHLVLVRPIAKSDDFAEATRGDVIAYVANLERRRWQRP